TATNAPPIPTARAPTGMLRNLPPVVPTFVTSWEKMATESNNIMMIKQLRTIRMRFTSCSFSTSTSLNHRKLPDFFTDSRCVNMIDIDAVRGGQIVPCKQIPLGHTVQDITVMADRGNQLSAHGVNSDRT